MPALCAGSNNSKPLAPLPGVGLENMELMAVIGLVAIAAIVALVVALAIHYGG